MVGIVVVTRAALLIARRASTWTVDEHLAGLSPGCVAVVASAPIQLMIFSGSVRKAKTVAGGAAIWVSRRTTSCSFIDAS